MTTKIKRLSKICKKCGKRKKINQFDKQSATKDGLRTWCKKCCTEYDKAYYQTHRIKLLDRATKRYYDNKGEQDGSK